MTQTAALNVLIHIPKTAGTTANDALRRHMGPGRAHIESLLAKPGRLGRVLAHAAWVSGHVPLPRMQAALEAVSERPMEYFTVLRDPVEQIASHYNWWIEVHRRGWLSYLRQGRYQREVSRHIRATNNSDPAAIIKVLEEHKFLFLNMQSKFVLGPRRGQSREQITAGLARYGAVGDSDDLAPFVSRICGRPVTVSRSRNVSPYGFDPAVFRSPDLAAFLAEHHADDIALYDTALAEQARKADDRTVGPDWDM